MFWKIFTVLLLLLNAATIGSHTYLVHSVQEWTRQRQALDVQTKNDLDSLFKQRAEVAALMSSLARQTNTHPKPAVPSGNEAGVLDARAGEEQFEIDTLWRKAALDSFHQRPNQATIPKLNPEELQALREMRETMPPVLNDGVLIQGDVASVLENSEWNPQKHELSADDRLELARLLSDYRYFARLSIMERVQGGVLPEIKRLRDAGAFLEYPQGEGPPVVDGVTISHGESSDRPGIDRE